MSFCSASPLKSDCELTEIAFHFGAPDKVAYAVRLLRKATGAGARVLVFGNQDLLKRLDASLWASAPTEFLPHCGTDATPQMLALSPVVLVAEDSGFPDLELPVLVNLGTRIPPDFESRKRLIEVVSTDQDDRVLARQRWKTYTALGFNILRHDLQLRG